MKYKNSSGRGAPVYGRCCAKSGSHVSDSSPLGLAEMRKGVEQDE